VGSNLASSNTRWKWCQSHAAPNGAHQKKIQRAVVDFLPQGIVLSISLFISVVEAEGKGFR